MNIQQFINKMKTLEKLFISYISYDEKVEENYQNINQFLNEHKIMENQSDLKLLLRFLLVISNNHHRTPNFFSKLEKIIKLIEEPIKEKISNFEIFLIFKSNKRILLFLIQNQILCIDKTIANFMMKKKYYNEQYPHYFYPEIKDFVSDKELVVEITEDFNEKRKIGENENYICNLIRNDSIDEFISYVNQNNLSLGINTRESIFETNPFLLKSPTTLIYYAAFFGSVQIFKYLYKNKAKISPNIWHYAIHSDNPELISEIEEIYKKLKGDSYKNIIQESIKCHHNDITNYIWDKYSIDDNLFRDLISSSLNYINFSNIEKEFINESIFIDLCEYDYVELVNYFLQTYNIDINRKIILKIILIQLQM